MEGALKEGGGAGVGFGRVVGGVRVVRVDLYCCWARGGGCFPREAGKVFWEVPDWLSETGEPVSSTRVVEIDGEEGGCLRLRPFQQVCFWLT